MKPVMNIDEVKLTTKRTACTHQAAARSAIILEQKAGLQFDGSAAGKESTM
jgi:hypothetical protein